MRVLVISETPWNDSNSFGNSYSNIFAGMEDIQFVNIYCSTGMPDNSFEMSCFQISFPALIKNLKNKKYATGKVVYNRSENVETLTEFQRKGFNVARILRWQILFWARDFVWKISRWKSEEFKEFLQEFSPEIIFQPVYYSSHVNDIVRFVKEFTGAPMVGYIADDNYTLRQFRLSPLYWIDRLWKRQKVKRTIEQCDILYVISEIQKKEYEKIFPIPCKILTKGVDFQAKSQDKLLPNIKDSLQIVYAGNLGSGRWRSLALIAKAVECLNQEGFAVELHTYSATPQTIAMRKKLGKSGCCFLHGAISYEELLEKQKHADILVHVEGMTLRNRLEVHQSFSTKLVDYFAMKKCILAVGTEDVASIAHLKVNDAALIASSYDETYDVLKRVLMKPTILNEYEKRAFQCGKLHHDRATFREMLYKDLRGIIERYESSSN